MAPEQRATLVEEAVRAAHGYQQAPAPAREPILRSLAAEIANLPPDQVASQWEQAMRVTSLPGRHEVLVDLAALAMPLIEVFGPPQRPKSMTPSRSAQTDRWL